MRFFCQGGRVSPAVTLMAGLHELGGRDADVSLTDCRVPFSTAFPLPACAGHGTDIVTGRPYRCKTHPACRCSGGPWQRWRRCWRVGATGCCWRCSARRRARAKPRALPAPHPPHLLLLLLRGTLAAARSRSAWSRSPAPSPARTAVRCFPAHARAEHCSSHLPYLPEPACGGRCAMPCRRRACGRACAGAAQRERRSRPAGRSARGWRRRLALPLTLPLSCWMRMQ